MLHKRGVTEGMQRVVISGNSTYLLSNKTFAHVRNQVTNLIIPVTNSPQQKGPQRCLTEF